MEVKKPVVIKDTRKVKKIQYVKQQVAPPANQRSGNLKYSRYSCTVQLIMKISGSDFVAKTISAVLWGLLK